MRSLGATENKWCAVFEKEQSNSTVKLGDVKSGWDKRSLECRLERGKIATSPLTSRSEVQLSFLQQTQSKCVATPSAQIARFSIAYRWVNFSSEVIVLA